MKYGLKIGWLYPELMSTYGDRGNIIVLQKRCAWREIKAEVYILDIGYSVNQLAECDLLFMGGAQDKQQAIVAKDLTKKAKILSLMIKDGVPGLYICGAYQFLGTYYKEADGTHIPGLNIFDIHTENPGLHTPRLIGNLIVKSKVGDLIGFENHGGRTYLGKNVEPLGKVIKGSGNNGEDGTEGAIYNNSFGTYMHGPILPKNPHLADLLISLALKRKYGKDIPLVKIDDSLEEKAHLFIEQRERMQ